jgi:hypothetical protein
MNPGAADKAAERGTWIHGAVENHIRGFEVRPPSAYEGYWKKVPEKMDEILEDGSVLWSEKPYNKPIWNRYVGDDGVGRLHFYCQQEDVGYAGCPDLIYTNSNKENVLTDVKTSVGPYSSKFPKAKDVMDESLRKALVSGVFKLKKTRLQLAAYKIAAEACLGIKIHKTQIFVATPLEEYPVQVFTFSEREADKDTEDWMKILRQFYKEPAIA